MITDDIAGVEPGLLKQFWDALLDGRGHPFLVLTEDILGNPLRMENVNIEAFRGFQKMVQKMCDNGVVTWTHTVFKKEIKREKGKQQSKENDDEVEPEEDLDGHNGNKKETKKKKEETVEYEVWTDGVLRLTEKAFPFGRPQKSHG